MSMGSNCFIAETFGVKLNSEKQLLTGSTEIQGKLYTDSSIRNEP